MPEDKTTPTPTQPTSQAAPTAKANLVRPDNTPSGPTAQTVKSPIKPLKRHWWSKLHAKWQSLSRRGKIITALVCLVVLATAATGAVLALHRSPLPHKTIHKVATPAKPTTVASPLTGVQVAPALAARPVTGIMIENSDDARPQSGLQDAGIVYEAIAEGGITRFMALFQDATPQYIGPVRSLRPYYLHFAAAFQAGIVHVGGSPDALNDVRSGQYRDLDQFFNSDYFTRVSSRAAPHNVYTSFAELDKLNQSKGYTSSKFTPWLRKADSKLATPTAKTINIAISGPDFNVHYNYDATTNSYLRTEGGAAHMDLVSADDTGGVQLKPKVVIALAMNYSIVDSSGHSGYEDTGEGTAYFFQDGGLTQGTWSRDAETGPFTFKDSAGKPVALNAGQTWITLASQSSDVTYAP